MTRATRRAWTASILLLLGAEARAQIINELITVEADTDYAPVLSSPAYPAGSGPVVGVFGLNTLFTITNRFLGLERLLTADGYVVQSFDQAFVPGCSANLAGCAYFQALLQVDVLVIANRADAISDEEADVLVGWLSGTLGCEGGCTPRRLFLSAGHLLGFLDPVVDHPAAIAELSERLGLVWPNGSLNARSFEFQPGDPNAEGLLIPHAVLAGAAEAELVDRVSVSGGTALSSAPPGAASALGILPGASDATAGASQGMTLQIGTGRVYASGNADMHTAQIKTVAIFGVGTFEHPLGLTEPGYKNQQYLLNVMHWLDGGPTPDADGDGIVDGLDNCVAKANGPAGSNQLDVDLDGFGNACDGDFDDDGDVDSTDFYDTFVVCFQGGFPPDDPTCAESDMNGNGSVNASDFGQFFIQVYNHPPGPSGLACADPAEPTAPCFARTVADVDGDDVVNGEDSCLGLQSASQRDTDLDGVGNACDGDFDNDGLVTAADHDMTFAECLSHTVGAPGALHDGVCAESDMDDSGVVDGADLDLFQSVSGTGQPGPSGKSCADARSRLEPCQPPPPSSGQQPDPNYNPVLVTPEYASRGGPLVGVDSTHDNFHVIANRFQAFYKLLTADGYDVLDFGVPFEAGCSSDLAACAYFQALKQLDTFVISNARLAISAEEAELILGWLSGSLGCASGCAPRQLFLIADHAAEANFPLRIVQLSQRLQLDWPNYNDSVERVFTMPLPIDFDPDVDGLLNNLHAIVQGRPGLDEDVVSVTTFRGSGFIAAQPPPDGISLLILPPGAMFTGGPSAAGYSQGMALEVGTGRVYASAEAGMFSAQYNGPEAPPPNEPFGMHVLPFDHNQQFLLNIVHWLDGLL